MFNYLVHGYGNVVQKILDLIVGLDKSCEQENITH